MPEEASSFDENVSLWKDPDSKVMGIIIRKIKTRCFYPVVRDILKGTKPGIAYTPKKGQ